MSLNVPSRKFESSEDLIKRDKKRLQLGTIISCFLFLGRGPSMMYGYCQHYQRGVT